MYSIDDLERALANTGRLIAGVRADQWHEPTPCTEWDVRQLVNHSTWVVAMFGAALDGREPALRRDADVLGDDPAAAFDSIAKNTLGVWKARGVDGTVRIPVGEIPAAVGLGINTIDVWVHGWDVARATGQDAQLDPALCEELLTFTREFISPEVRARAFAPAVEIDDDAPVADRLVAFTGRKP